MSQLLALGMLLSSMYHGEDLRQEYVRTTFYTLSGTTASGEKTHLGVAACSKWIPFGTRLELPDGFVVTCFDRGDGDRYWKAWIDVWAPSREWGKVNVVNSYGDYAWVSILRWGWEEEESTELS